MGIGVLWLQAIRHVLQRRSSVAELMISRKWRGILFLSRLPRGPFVRGTFAVYVCFIACSAVAYLETYFGSWLDGYIFLRMDFWGWMFWWLLMVFLLIWDVSNPSDSGMWSVVLRQITRAADGDFVLVVFMLCAVGCWNFAFQWSYDLLDMEWVFVWLLEIRVLDSWNFTPV